LWLIKRFQIAGLINFTNSIKRNGNYHKFRIWLKILPFFAVIILFHLYESS
jgi:hypothetical protein